MTDASPEPQRRQRKRTPRAAQSASLADPGANHEPAATLSSPTAAEPVTTPDPATTRDFDDPGDATQRNYRYQHAYGVMLMVAASRGDKPYVAIWCEHHEDVLAQRDDDRYDAYQVKTSRPECGAWRMNDADVVKSIGRFVDLVREFGDRIANVFFVSNTEYDHISDNSKDVKRCGRRPRAFLAHLRQCTCPTQVTDPYAETFTDLQGQCGCSSIELFETLRRMDLILGPSRDAFHAVLAHEHLGRLSDCRSLGPQKLDEWCEDLIATVCRACSLVVTDPIRHLAPLINGSGVDPTLAAKCLLVAEVMVYKSRLETNVPYRFPGDPGIRLGDLPRPSILREKLGHGDLADQVDYLSERARAAEYNLIEIATMQSDGFSALLRQVEQMVLGECTEAYLRARVAGEPYGPAMMIDVQDRLRRLSQERPAMVGNLPYECLMGVVGLLTTDTRVWWSPRFPIQESAA